ncbi:MAG: glycoside hydrolase family 76 protein [Clostridia bacterium]
MKRAIAILLSLALVFSSVFFVVGCKEPPDDTPADTLPDEPIIDPRIVEITEDFIDVFWNAEHKMFYTINTKHIAGRSGPLFGLYSDFWWEAQNWETVMDIYERQGGEYYLTLVDDVYDGFLQYYDDYQKNEYNDDIGWWAMGCTRAYAITGNERYLTDAKEMFDYIYQYKDDAVGGGLYWKNTGDNPSKNVCTNAPAATTAARLSVHLDDPSYLQIARELFDWLKTSLYEEETGKVNDTKNANDGSVNDWQFSYNYGTFARVAYELYKVTGEEDYMEYVYKSLDYYIATRLTNGIAIKSGGGMGDETAFRTILFRTLNEIAKTSRPDYQQVINDNALSAYNNRRDSDKLCGFNWTVVPKDDELITSTVAGAGVALMQYYQELGD